MRTQIFNRSEGSNTHGSPTFRRPPFGKELAIIEESNKEGGTTSLHINQEENTTIGFEENKSTVADNGSDAEPTFKSAFKNVASAHHILGLHKPDELT